MWSRNRFAGIVLAVAGVMAISASAANAQDVSVNFAPTTDFFKYTTYRWVEIQGAEKADQLVDTQIKQSVDKALAAKGLTKVESGEATLLIGYQFALSQERQVNSYSSGGYGYGGWYGGYGGYGGMGMSSTTSTTSTIHIGTIAIDMYDSAEKALVWRGQASKTLDTKAKPDKRQKNLDKAMTKLFKDFRKPKKK